LLLWLLLGLLSALRLSLLGLTILLCCWASLLSALLPLRLLGLRSTLLLLRCAFVLPALRPIGLALVPSLLIALIIALPVTLRVGGQHRSEEQERGGRTGYSHEFHGE